MIDPATGMKAGERHSVENVERAHQFPGFFLDENTTSAPSYSQPLVCGRASASFTTTWMLQANRFFQVAQRETLKT